MRAPPPVPRATKPLRKESSEGESNVETLVLNGDNGDKATGSFGLKAPALPPRKYSTAVNEPKNYPPLPARCLSERQDNLNKSQKPLPPPQRRLTVSNTDSLDDSGSHGEPYYINTEPFHRVAPRAADPIHFAREPITAMLESPVLVTAGLRLSLWTDEPVFIDFTDHERIVCLVKYNENLVLGGSKDGWVYVIDVRMGIVQKKKVHQRAIVFLGISEDLLVVDAQGNGAKSRFEGVLMEPYERVVLMDNFQLCFGADESVWAASPVSLLKWNTKTNQRLAISHNYGEVRHGTRFRESIVLAHKSGMLTFWKDGVCTKELKFSARPMIGMAATNTELWIATNQGIVTVLQEDLHPLVTFQAQNNLSGMYLGSHCYTWDALGEIKTWDTALTNAKEHKRLVAQQKSRCTFKPLLILLITFNCAANPPGNLKNMFTSAPDIIHIALQEVIDLQDKVLTAKSLFLSAGKMSNTAYESVYNQWRTWFQNVISIVYSTEHYSLLSDSSLIGLQSLVFIKVGLKVSSNTNTVKTGVGNMYGNKGAIITTVCIDDSSICLINAHLAAGQANTRDRNADVSAIHEASLEHNNATTCYIQGMQGQHVFDHEFVFLTGDLNYRIDLRRDTVLQRIQSQQWTSLLRFDQLTRSRRPISTNAMYSDHLQRYAEPNITFAPTYKFDIGTSVYDTIKLRTPAWCDRVLYRTLDSDRIKVLEYMDIACQTSDHRPVRALFEISVKCNNTFPS